MEEHQQPHQENPTQKHNRWHLKRPIVGPLILIVIGLTWLANNLGLHVNWSIIWPSVLIILGLIMIIDRRSLSGWLIGLVIFVLFIYLGYALFIQNNLLGNFGVNTDSISLDFGFKNRETKTKDINVRQDTYPDIDAVKLKVDIGVGSYDLTSVKDEQYILTSQGTYNYDLFAPQLLQTKDNDTLSLNYGVTDNHRIPIFTFNQLKADYRLNLGRPDLPTSLDLKTGTGRANVNLTDQNMPSMKLEIGTGEMDVEVNGKNISPSNLSFDIGTGKLRMHGLGNANLTELQGKFGTGSVDLNFDGEWTQAKASTTIDGGTGSLKIQLPSSIGFKITPHVGTGHISINDERLKDDQEFTSTNYQTASYLMDFTLDIGTGSIEITSS